MPGSGSSSSTSPSLGTPVGEGSPNNPDPGSELSPPVDLPELPPFDGYVPPEIPIDLIHTNTNLTVNLNVDGDAECDSVDKVAIAILGAGMERRLWTWIRSEESAT